jgi:RsiW-degrading membrane proteinase PrsW (M82 family)
MKIMKWFDLAFLAGLFMWVLFAFILPALFNTDNDVTLGMVFLIIAILGYALVRFFLKMFTAQKGDL